MPTADDLAAQLARIDHAAAALTDIRTFVAGLTADAPADEPAGPAASLTPGWPEATASTTNPATAVDVTWAVPVGSARTLVSWGTTAGQAGQTFVPAPGESVTLEDLRPGAVYVIDLLSEQPDGTFHPQARARLTVATAPGPTPEPEPGPGGYPTDPKAWDQKRDWTTAHAGAPTTGLTVIDSPATLSAAGLPGTWTNGQWSLPTGGTYTRLDVRGLIHYTGPATLHLIDTKARGVRFTAAAGKTGGLIERCHITGNPALALGQGAVNYWGQTGWVIRRTILEGFADGVQCSQSGLIEEFRDPGARVRAGDAQRLDPALRRRDRHLPADRVRLRPAASERAQRDLLVERPDRGLPVGGLRPACLRQARRPVEHPPREHGHDQSRPLPCPRRAGHPRRPLRARLARLLIPRRVNPPTGRRTAHART